ncbi:hypothetical protein OCU04_004266 [Sclerotinia nivalis]|uniref:Protein kinase domain-containing protein n=1 Tax=Sclerotinia nivalis TaxID=352851 RepID=A0A9X0ATI7_9HELO|nr:hypothetical protein OCU04_004266 [Sclerotinia nivalis]
MITWYPSQRPPSCTLYRIQTMAWGPKCWIARYLKSGHEFQIGNDIWKLSGSPINEAEYEDFSRAVYECRVVHEREGIKSPAVVKIWMQTPEINTYDDWIHASELYDSYLAENLDRAGDSDIASHSGSRGRSISASSLVSAGDSDIANHSNHTGNSDSAVKSNSVGHSDIASHLGSDSHLSSVNHLSSARNSDSAAHSISVDNSHSAGDSDIASHLDSATHSGSLSNPDTANEEDWDEEFKCLNILKESYDRLQSAATAAEEEVQIPSKPFPHAIGLAKHEQERNFPVQGGYLVYLVMEKLPGDCILPGVFWGQWNKSERDDFRRAFEESAVLIRKLGVENRDKAMRNLLYDREDDKCYFIDWEDWRYCDVDECLSLPNLQYSYEMIRDRGPMMGADRWDKD